MVDPELPIRLIALDIDGTLVGDDMVIGERTMAAVAEARCRGIVVSLVTGRMATSAIPFAEALSLKSPIVAMQGALVRAMPSPGSRRPGRLLYHRRLRSDVTTEIVRWCGERGLTPHLNYLEWMIVGPAERHVEDYRIFVGDRLRVVSDIAARARGPVTKVVAVGESDHTIELLEEARAHFAGRAEVTLGHPTLLEFLAWGVSKGTAIRWLAHRLGVPLAQCFAAGNQFNDLEMLSEVGHGVAMPSAPAAVQAAARFVAPPVDDEGAAQMIERLALDGWRLEPAGRGPASSNSATRRGVQIQRR